MTEFEDAVKKYMKTHYPVKRFAKIDPNKVGSLYETAGLKDFLSKFNTPEARKRWYHDMNEKSKKEVLNTLEGIPHWVVMEDRWYKKKERQYDKLKKVM